MVSKIFKELVKIMFDLGIIILSYVIPKNNNLFVFSSHHGNMFKSNPRYLYFYFQKRKNVMWITNNIKLCTKLKENALEVSYTYSFKGIWSVLRAKYIFIDNGMRGPLASGILAFLGRFKIIQTTHGIPLKNVRWLDFNFKGISRLAVYFSLLSYRCVLASSRSDKELKEKSFRNQNVKITGLPRNDIFFNRDLVSHDWISELGLEKFDRIILYAPTFRDSYSTIPFSVTFLEELDIWLNTNNFILLIKQHPSESVLKNDIKLKNIRNITNIVEDVQDLLTITDILVTDYSGISVDYVLTERPIIFYIYDYNKYLEECRDFYYDFDKTIPGPFARSQEELKDLLENMHWFDESDYKTKYHYFLNLFHEFKDGKSCERVEKLLSDPNGI